MGNVALLASGSGSNFQAICEELSTGPHVVVGLLCDQPGAPVLRRAEVAGVPSAVVPYHGLTPASRRVTEKRMRSLLDEWNPNLIVLAGFMRVLTPEFVDAYPNRIVNIHPALLPKYQGLNAIRRSYEARDKVVGITVHFVDHGVDTGSIIRQETLSREKDETLADLETRVHALEHRIYPEVIRDLLARSGPSDAGTEST